MYILLIICGEQTTLEGIDLISISTWKHCVLKHHTKWTCFWLVDKLFAFFFLVSGLFLRFANQTSLKVSLKKIYQTDYLWN